MRRKSPQQILHLFQKHYKVLKDIQISQMNNDMVKKYHGYALFTIDDEIFYKGKTRQRKVHPYKILLNKELKQNVYVLLHEISHCLSPYVERKHSDQWIYMEHERQFYQHLFEIIKIANKQGVYDKKFKNVEDLMKFDKTV